MMRASDVLDQDSVIFAALPLFHTNALVVTVLAPLLKGQHVVWGGPLGYRDLPLFQNFWKIVERYRIASMSARPHGLRGASRRVPVDADISSLKLPVVGAAPLPPAVADRVRGPHRRRAVRGLRPDRGHVCQRAQLARRRPPGNGRAAPALPAGARRRHRRGDRRVDVPPRGRGRDARAARPQHLRRLPRRQPTPARSCAPTARSRTAGSTPATWPPSTRMGSSGSPAAPRT